jgi:hypothetical protein
MVQAGEPAARCIKKRPTRLLFPACDKADELEPGRSRLAYAPEQLIDDAVQICLVNHRLITEIAQQRQVVISSIVALTIHDELAVPLAGNPVGLVIAAPNHRVDCANCLDGGLRVMVAAAPKSCPQNTTALATCAAERLAAIAARADTVLVRREPADQYTRVFGSAFTRWRKTQKVQI